MIEPRIILILYLREKINKIKDFLKNTNGSIYCLKQTALHQFETNKNLQLKAKRSISECSLFPTLMYKIKKFAMNRCHCYFWDLFGQFVMILGNSKSSQNIKKTWIFRFDDHKIHAKHHKNLIKRIPKKRIILGSIKPTLSKCKAWKFEQKFNLQYITIIFMILYLYIKS